MKNIKVYQCVKLLALFVFCFEIACTTGHKEKYQTISTSKLIKDNPFSKDTLYIHLQGGFKNDSILIYIDNVNVVNQRVTSDKVWDLAYEFRCPRYWIDSKISIIHINDKQNKQCKIVINKNQIDNNGNVLNFVAINRRKRELLYVLKSNMDLYD
ncbi:hypothetical protein EYV94_27705 [Puteibacter caeruleilacunae]|nr:hypothetical protein EYV94_27705 [Puteibacter caeruleilacunae]